MLAVPDVTSDEYWQEDEPVFQGGGDHHVSVFFLTNKGSQDKYFADKSPAALTG